ncbi:MAG: MBG domain-containing protein [Opitutaceae bacterium]
MRKNLIIRAVAAMMALTIDGAIAAPVRIMTLGDSITQGGDGLASYRDPLIDRLNSEGYSGKFQMVGGMSKTRDDDPTSSVYAGHPNHEGHYGWRADEILDGNPAAIPGSGSGKLSQWLSGYTPDVVLLHIGTNDAIWDADGLNPDPEPSLAAFAATTWGEISSIIQTINAAHPGARIFVAQIISVRNADDVQARIDALNPVIGANAADVDATVVSFPTFNAGTMLDDAFHPNASGESNMAAAWFSAIESTLDDLLSPVITSSSSAGATVGESFSYTITASENPTGFDASNLPPGLAVNTSTGVISGTPTAAGMYAVEITATNSFGTGEDEVVVTIGKANATVTLSNLSQTYDGSIKFVDTSTSPAGLEVDVTYDGSGTAPADAGTYAVEAAIDDADYSGSASDTLVIAKASQSITFTALEDKTLGDAPFELSASSSAGLPVSFSVVSGSAAIEGPEVTLTGAGPVTVRASQPGNGNFAAAAPVDRSFTVTAGTATVVLTGLAHVYDGSAKPVGVTTNPAGLNVAITYAGGAAAPANAGSYAVSAVVDDANYSGSASGTLQISKASATVTLGNLVHTFNGSPKSATSTTTPAGLPVTITYDGSSTVPSAMGTYAVVATVDDFNYSGSAAATLSISEGGRLINLSSRAFVGTGGDIMIPGFVVVGSGTKSLLIRGAGPELEDLGVTGVLEQPTLTLIKKVDADTNEEVAANTGWSTAPNVQEIIDRGAEAGAFPFAPGSADCAILTDVTPGSYTVQLSGVNNTTGVGMVEIYDLDETGSSARLVNLSSRAQVGTGANILIPGFVVDGGVSRTVLIRAVGPTLDTLFSLGGVLADPTIVVRKNIPVAEPQVMGSNDNWETNANLAELNEATAAVGAFPLDAGSTDAAILLTLDPGVYTVTASGVGATTGIALVEVYEVEE